ncbi:replication protein A 70 kDa DNA-binding subunit B-like [Dendrobium catenatum]|uniref:replication protein A 70 kDa DNA-binding subunit B-like n=1 Tax=Dendrobium catenatum TaxID=906689 RepID=UPI00109F2190|nr:replication protein A 70 kDa DNA-binding subunit B-like [Dendrobium catenatum]
MTSLQKINTSEHSTGEIKHYYTRVFAKGLNQEGSIWYNSCNTCKSKVTIIDGIVQCTKCTNENVQCSLRYLIKLSVEDNSSTAIFTLFDNEAEQLIGMPVIELEKIKASKIEDYNNIIKNILEKEMTFLVKAQDKIYGSRTFRSLTVQSIKMDSNEVGELQHKKIKIEEV